jgi:hypothetical protein
MTGWSPSWKRKALSAEFTSSDCPESGRRGKAASRQQPMVFASMASLPSPFAAYSKGPGLTELLRLYVCGLQPRASVQL